MNRKPILPLIIVGGLLGMIVLMAVWVTLPLLLAPRKPPLADFGAVPEFKLTERSGKPVALADLSGKVWIADFIFTHCAGPCPLMSARMAELQKALRNSPDVLLVSFSVDPERDTPEVFARYADNYGASKTQWLFLTGDKRDIFPLVRNGFKLVAQEAESDETEDAGGPILHSTLFVLVDARGRIRGYYDGTASETVVQLAADAQSLLRARN